jgi:hypothetical protein
VTDSSSGGEIYSAARFVRTLRAESTAPIAMKMASACS